ncbi:hypothetical protein PP348_20260 [Mycobacteroides abscessus]|uniref:hypothetical protein n=1 Tax=Mycobacteroides abscessus TaxID=36809 RepID=UPI0021065726|nr:hypothetical protein [Mycobacteroides abscessus]MDM2096410.1 hypothetical protein [Mycobacteroides abscessus]MDM2121141.1 hypothetical protein [Mycobacteroides abscessus]MDM2124364.1 hypothetical protein [Mycobacteroides abscessus]MDM2130549.1 hypothetical protein [Mycobacteroides abscessus]MDM2203062.1 hypothetical protein [Mycobacteroides abscessus]
MDRKDFLKHVAIGSVALIGGGTLLRLTSLGTGADTRSDTPGSAYGTGSVYGGHKAGDNQPQRRRTT